MATSKKRSSTSSANQTKRKSTRMTKKERMQQMERREAFIQEIILWIFVAISLLLFISNLGIGGIVGNTVSGFFFGVFALIVALVICLTNVTKSAVNKHQMKQQADNLLYTCKLFMYFS